MLPLASAPRSPRRLPSISASVKVKENANPHLNEYCAIRVTSFLLMPRTGWQIRGDTEYNRCQWNQFRGHVFQNVQTMDFIVRLCSLILVTVLDDVLEKMFRFESVALSLITVGAYGWQL
jgi:hypothetical protein